MNAKTKNYLKAYLWIAFTICVAAYLKHFTFYNVRLDRLAAIMSFTILISCLVYWMLSIKWRCMHSRIRNYIMASGAGLIFWLVVTLLRKDFAVLPIVKRQLWYLSYIPVIFVPLMSVGAASYVSKSDMQPRDRFYCLLWIPSAILCILMLTNEFHGIVFDVMRYDTHDVITQHTPLCIITVCWAVFLELVAILMMIIKSKNTTLSRARFFVPLCIFVCGIMYLSHLLCGIIDESIIEMPTAISFFFVAIYESCLFLRLLPTNFYYRNFFECSDIGMQILDNEDAVKIRSNKARALTESEINEIKAKKMLLAKGVELHGEPVQGGFFVYEKDIRTIQQEIDELKEVKVELEDTNNYIKEQQQIKIRKKRLEEKERIFNQVAQVIAPSLEKIDNMLKDISKFDYEKQLNTMWRINFLGTYIKRRANLELRRRESPVIFGSELSQCLAEYAVSLGGVGISTNCLCGPEAIIPPESAILLLDVYMNMIEDNWTRLKNISVIQSCREGNSCYFIEGLGHRELFFSKENLQRFTDYAQKNHMKVSFELGEIPSILSIAVIIADGGSTE